LDADDRTVDKLKIDYEIYPVDEEEK